VKHALTSGLRVPPPTEMGVGPRRGMAVIFGNKDEEGWTEGYKASGVNDSAHWYMLRSCEFGKLG
jgi:hypothetical protein